MVTGGAGEKPEHRHPSSIKTSPYWWMTDAGIRNGAFLIATNTMARTERERIQGFFWHPPPSVLCHRICGDPEGNNFNTGIRPPSITGSFDGRWISDSPRPGFFNVSGHTTVSQIGVFLSLFWPRTSVTIPKLLNFLLKIGRFTCKNRQIFLQKFSDGLAQIVKFSSKNRKIYLQKWSNFSERLSNFPTKIVIFFYKNGYIFLQKSTNFFAKIIKISYKNRLKVFPQISGDP